LIASWSEFGWAAKPAVIASTQVKQRDRIGKADCTRNHDVNPQLIWSNGPGQHLPAFCFCDWCRATGERLRSNPDSTRISPTGATTTPRRRNRGKVTPAGIHHTAVAPKREVPGRAWLDFRPDQCATRNTGNPSRGCRGSPEGDNARQVGPRRPRDARNSFRSSDNAPVVDAS
jgi:hypothetical protein